MAHNYLAYFWWSWSHFYSQFQCFQKDFNRMTEIVQHPSETEQHKAPGGMLFSSALPLSFHVTYPAVCNSIPAGTPAGTGSVWTSTGAVQKESKLGWRHVLQLGCGWFSWWTIFEHVFPIFLCESWSFRQHFWSYKVVGKQEAGAPSGSLIISLSRSQWSITLRDRHSFYKSGSVSTLFQEMNFWLQQVDSFDGYSITDVGSCSASTVAIRIAFGGY